jgi:hypothetical protein
MATVNCTLKVDVQGIPEVEAMIDKAFAQILRLKTALIEAGFSAAQVDEIALHG